MTSTTWRLILSLAMILCSLAAMATAQTREVRIVIPKEILQQQIKNAFPVERGSFLATVALSNPALELYEGSDKIWVNFDMVVVSDQFGEYPGKGAIRSGLRYDNDEGALYLQNCEVTKIEFDDIPSLVKGPVSSVVNTIADEYLVKEPVYTLDKKNQVQQLVKGALRWITVKDGEVVALFDIPADIVEKAQNAI